MPCVWAKVNQKLGSGSTFSPYNGRGVKPPEMHLGWVSGPPCELFHCRDALFWCHAACRCRCDFRESQRELKLEQLMQSQERAMEPK